MARQNRQNRFPSRNRPSNREWVSELTTSMVTLAPASKVLVTTFVLSNPGIDETVLRTVGGIAIASDQSAADEEQLGALGICVVTDRAITVGITAVLDPVTEADDDFWLLYVPFAQRTNLALTGPSSVWYPFDSKGKRVLHNGYSLAVVVANASASFSIQFAMNIRELAMVRGTG